MKVRKDARQQMLLERLEETPFLTDEKLARMLSVSVQTIRLDRLEMGIPELRIRMRELAERAGKEASETEGEILRLEPGRSGTSLLRITETMVFAETGIVKESCLFSQANFLAAAIVGAPGVSTRAANVKYKRPVRFGEELVAQGELIRIRGNRYFVWVKTRNGTQEVFRAKFILVSEGQGKT